MTEMKLTQIYIFWSPNEVYVYWNEKETQGKFYS